MTTMTLNWTALILIGLPGALAGAEAKTDLQTEKDRTSYTIGVDMARNFKRQGLQIDLDMVMRGFMDADAGAKLLLAEPEMTDLRKAYMAAAMRELAVSKRTPAQENERR